MRSRSSLAAAAWACVALATSCGDDPASRVSSLTTPALPTRETSPGRSGDTLRIGVASILSSNAALGHYRRLVEHVGEELGIPTRMVLGGSNAEMNEMLSRRYVAVAFVCNYAYVRAHRDFGAELLAVPVVRGAPTYRAYIVVRKDDPIHALEDLAGKRFAYADPLCNAGWLFPAYRFRKVGGALPGDLADEIFTHDYEASLQAVVDGVVDASGIESPLYDAAVERRAPASLATRILEASPPMGNPPVVVRRDMAGGLKKRLADLLLGLHRTQSGREILAGMEVERFVEPDPAWYEPVFRMSEDVERP